jgi:hypothetical protein
MAALSNLADIATYEERIQLEYALELRICIWCRTLGVEVVDVYILELAIATTLNHSLDEALWS